MIVLPEGGLTPLERHGLDVLVDLSRLLPAPEGLGATRLLVVPEGPEGVDALQRDPTVADGIALVPRATLATAAAFAAATEEQGTTERDPLGRVPSEANGMVRAGVADTPILSTWAMRLRQAVARSAGSRPFRALSPWPHGKRWAATISHDLDVVAAWPIFTALRLAELARKGEWGQVRRTLTAAARDLFGDPVGVAARQILAVEAELGVRSNWFILCGTPTFDSFRRGDLTYRPESRATRMILEMVAAGGHEIGLHGSMETASHPERFRRQRQRLGALIPALGPGVRQHFLRMDPGPTQRGMVEGGAEYDATWGFSDRNGFRTGAADVLPWFDAKAGRIGALDLVPFCWMDRTQSKYQGIEDPAEWVRVALERAERCREVEGLWCGIWHPNLAAALGYPGAMEAFSELARGLASSPTAWQVPLAEVVAWRRRRREARAIGMTVDGGVVARTSRAGEPLWLEDAHGTPVEKVEG